MSNFNRRTIQFVFFSLLSMGFGTWLVGPTLVEAWQPLKNRVLSTETAKAPFESKGISNASVPDQEEPAEIVVQPKANISVTNTNDSGAGSLRAAVAAAVSGDTIDFGGLTLPATITLTSGHININKSLIIVGPGATQLTINGNNNSRIFLVHDGNDASNSNVSISGISFTNGNGAGETIPGAGGTFFTGGSIYSNENLTLTNCAIFGNTVGAGSGGGGAMVLNVGTNLIQGCTFSGNTVTNSGSNGGAFTTSSGTTTVVNSTISGNVAPNSGGAAIVQSTGNLTFRNCTVVSNTANGLNGGGGLRVTGASAALTLINTIVAGNSCPNTANANDLTRSSGTLTGNNNVIGDANAAGGLTNGTNGNIVGVGGSGVRALNTIINTTLTNNGGPTNTHVLAAGSVAIDAGSNTNASSFPTDQRGIGFNRFNGTVDIGAVENGVTAPTFTGVTPLGVPAQQYGTLAGATHTLNSFTVPPGTNRLLVVTASHTNFIDVSTVTFGGTAMTKAIEKDDASVAVDSIWYLALGTSTSSTTGNIVATFATSGTVNNGTGLEAFLSAQAFSNVNQTTPTTSPVSSNNPNGTNVSASDTVTSATGDLVFDIFDAFINGTGTLPNVTPGAGQASCTRVTGTVTGSGGAFDSAAYSTSIKPGAASVTMSWTSNTIAMIHAAINIQQVPAGTTVSSINRASANPTCSPASVSWTVTFAGSVTGVTSSNFSLVDGTSSLTGESITGVSGSGTTWTVTASTGTGTGTLGLNMVNSTGVSLAVTNLPFTGQTYTVNAPPATPTITPTPSSVCASSTGNQASGPAGATSYAWTITNGTITSATNIQTITYTAGASGTVQLGLTVTNAAGCAASNNANVTINALPAVPTITSAPSSVCANSTLNTASAPLGATSYAWTITNGTITAGMTNQTVTYTAGASGTVGLMVTVTNAAGCSRSNTANVTINANPSTPPITPTPATVCGNSAGNTASGPAGATTYAWTITNGTITSATNIQTITYTAGASGTVQLSLTVTNASGCSANNTANVTINAAPATPTITPTPSSVCASSTGNQASGPAGATSYAWTITNGTITSATNIQTITYTAGASGTVQLMLTVTNASGCAASNNANVTINALPAVPTITPAPSSVCANSTLNTASAPLGATSYAWTITNGTITAGMTNQTVTYTAGASGTVGLMVTVTNSSGCSRSNNANVTINALPGVPTITPTPSSVCASSTGNQASGPAGATTYAWTITNGTITSATNIQTITYTAGASGTVQLGLTVTNASGCAASNNANVTINALPGVPTITPTPSSVCASSTGNQASGPAGATTYAWTITNGTITSATNIQTITYTAGASGTVQLMLTVTNAGGCSASNTANVTINAAPSATITAPGGPLCTGATGNTASVPDAGVGATYNWSITNGTITAG
ncbi:MAG: hypothetical protein K1Y36_24570, partial [Blastocatellia bacterium]|nr:hypothetical protein [Blastocatellia bacterium]